MATQKKLRIGVFIPAGAQLLDMSPIDLFGMLDPAYLTACQLPSSLTTLGTPSTIEYISTPQANGHVPLTANAYIRISKTIDDADIQPGSLHIILVPGPDPAEIFDQNVRAFIKAHADWRGENGQTTDILSVCTGCILLGQAGVLKGKTASGPRAIIPTLAKNFPDTEWDEDKRWVHDGNVWTSGGITNGLEMVAQYIRENFPGPAGEAVLAMADVGTKGLNYTTGKPRETLWWLWQILRSLTASNNKHKSL